MTVRGTARIGENVITMNGVEIRVGGAAWTEDEVCNVSRLRYADGFGIRRHTVVDSTATVTHETVPGSLGSAEIYENSTALGFLQRLHNRVESGVISFFLWFDQSFRCSFVGTVLVSVKEALESWVPSSICARVIKWVFKCVSAS